MYSEELRKAFFPYCLQRLKSGGWIILNRNYKPLGQLDKEWVDYETHPSAVKFERFTLATAKKLSKKPIEGKIPDAIWLYSDGTSPTLGGVHMAAYLDKLAVLVKLRAKPLAGRLI